MGWDDGILRGCCLKRERGKEELKMSKQKIKKRLEMEKMNLFSGFYYISMISITWGGG